MQIIKPKLKYWKQLHQIDFEGFKNVAIRNMGSFQRLI